jgi:hypothetical protein
MMILCVAKIDIVKSSPSDDTTTRNDPPIFLELTDGWYSVYAKLDSFLCRMVQNGRICTGMKLMISNASLHGSEGGVDPLDEDFECSPETSLHIFANSSRIARWDSKLGFLKICRRLLETEGLMHVERLGDIIEGGGRVPTVEFEIVRRHPILFLQKSADHTSSVLTEAQEEARMQQLEDAKSKVAEEASPSLQEECTKVSPTSNFNQR